MRKLLCLVFIIPFLGFSQQKNVLNSIRVFPRQDKLAEFDKALAAHAQKYHTGNWKWRVWSIQSGPDAGGYMITEGPDSWADLDGRGDLGADHTADFEKNVAPLTTERGGSSYTEFQADLSTVELTDYADKIVINHMVAKPGMIGAFPDMIKKQKSAWQAAGMSVAVYLLVASGDPGYITVSRLKGGLKELASDYRKPMKDYYNSANGAGSWDAYMKTYADLVQSRWSELLIYKPELSSK